MKKHHLAATFTLCAACAMPVLAQGSGSSGSTGASSTSTPTSSAQTTPDTTTMGSSPSAERPTVRVDNDRDWGWLGLLGLAGLLGLRRKPETTVVDNRHTGAAR